MIVQNIIAHILKPKDHIKIIACIPPKYRIGKTVLANTVNQLVIKNNFNEISNKYLWALLNSTVINWYVYNFIFAFAIRTMHFYNPISSKVPILVISPEAQLPIIAKADTMLDKNKELHEIRIKILNFLKNKLDIEKPSKKLQNWHLLTTKEFLKELSKKKVKLSLEDEMAWIELFEKKQTQALYIKTIIDKTDKEIDAMVYELYGLTEEEIKIVEGSGA